MPSLELTAVASAGADLLEWHWQPAAALADHAELAAAWDRLNALQKNLPFMASAVLRAALDTFGHGDERLVVARSRGCIVAMLVVREARALHWHTFQPSQLPLGAFVAEPGRSLPALARSLLRHCPRLPLALSLSQLDPWLTPRPADTAEALATDYIDTGWIDIEGSFADYWAARGKNLRQNMKKQRAKLADEGISVSVQALRGRAEMAPALARYGALESSGWKAAEGTAIHPDNAQGKFYTAVFEGAAERGEAVIYECRFNDRTVAMNLCLQREGVLVVLKTTYDESIRTCSPAFLLNQDVTEQLFAEGRVRRLEYYGRLMDWHTKWTDQHRTLYHLTQYRWPVVRRLAEWRRARAEAAAAPAPPIAEAASAPPAADAAAP